MVPGARMEKIAVTHILNELVHKLVRACEGLHYCHL